jgi:hypothetical protein
MFQDAPGVVGDHADSLFIALIGIPGTTVVRPDGAGDVPVEPVKQIAEEKAGIRRENRRSASSGFSSFGGCRRGGNWE